MQTRLRSSFITTRYRGTRARVPDYQQATRALECRASVDLERGLLVGITLHLAQPGGLAEFLDRKLHGPAPALAGLADHQQRRSGLARLETSAQREA